MACIYLTMLRGLVRVKKETKMPSYPTTIAYECLCRRFCDMCSILYFGVMSYFKSFHTLLRADCDDHDNDNNPETAFNEQRLLRKTFCAWSKLQFL